MESLLIHNPPYSKAYIDQTYTFNDYIYPLVGGPPMVL